MRNLFINFDRICKTKQNKTVLKSFPQAEDRKSPQGKSIFHVLPLELDGKLFSVVLLASACLTSLPESFVLPGCFPLPLDGFLLELCFHKIESNIYTILVS